MKGKESDGPARRLPQRTVRTHCHSRWWGRLWKAWVWGEDGELGSGHVTPEMPVGYPVELLDRQMDTEMWDSRQRHVSGSYQNKDDL